MEIFYESFLTEDFSKKKNIFKLIQRAVIIIAAVSYIFWGRVITLIMGLIYLITIIVSEYIFVEYEYTLTNNELDITKIINKSKRREICTIDISKISKVVKIENSNEQVTYKKCYVGNDDLNTIVITAPCNEDMISLGLKINNDLLVLLKRLNPSVFNLI